MTTRRLIGLFWVVVCSLWVAGSALTVHAQVPQLPQAFYGVVTINGLPAPVGTEVEARGTGVETGVQGNPLTVVLAGQYGGPSVFDPKLIVQGAGIPAGSPISFYVNNIQAEVQPAGGGWQNTYPFSSGAVTELNVRISYAPADVDADGRTDLTFWRPSNGLWYMLKSGSTPAYDSGGAGILAWGMASDIPLFAHLDADGKADPMVWRPSTGTWYGLLSTRSYSAAAGDRLSKPWGLSGDIPLVGDMDADGVSDLLIWQPSTGWWYGALSSQAYGTAAGQRFSKAWGTQGDVPLVTDLDADGRIDLLIWRPSTGTWYGALSGQRFTKQWGVNGDVPLD